MRRPKVYGFDTGFVTFVKGWESIREDDRGLLWEHLVLDELRARLDERAICYWRDKSGRELDFVVKRPEHAVDVYECKVNPDNFDPETLRVFRSQYPKGRNFVTGPWIEHSLRAPPWKPDGQLRCAGESSAWRSADAHAVHQGMMPKPPAGTNVRRRRQARPTPANRPRRRVGRPC